MLLLEPLHAPPVSGAERGARANLVALVASSDQSLADFGYELARTPVEEVLISREGGVYRGRSRGWLGAEQVAHRAGIDVIVAGYLVVPVVPTRMEPGVQGDGVPSEAR